VEAEVDDEFPGFQPATGPQPAGDDKIVAGLWLVAAVLTGLWMAACVNCE
jgi:hypothetical protein